MSAPPTKTTFEEGPKTPKTPNTFNTPNITEEARKEPEKYEKPGIKRADTSSEFEKAATPGAQSVTFGDDVHDHPNGHGRAPEQQYAPSTTAKQWIPIVLSPAIPATLIVVMILAAIGLEVRYNF
jgi:hypothetical protein